MSEPDRPVRSAPLASEPRAAAALEALLAGVAQADPTKLVRRAVREGLLDDWFGDRERPRPIHVLAVGKAAPRMLWGLVEAGVPFRGIGAAPAGVPMPGIDTFQWHKGEHPIPGPGSFAAGAAVLEWAATFPVDEPILVLLSGGSSACLEAPAPGHSEADVRALNDAVWRGGIPIEEMNRRRAELSAIKGGRLGRLLLQRTPRIRVWVLADTDPATAAQTIGSALLWQAEDPERIPHRILSSSDELAQAAAAQLAATPLGRSRVYRHGARISGALEDEVRNVLAAHEALPAGSILVAAGEPTVQVPATAPGGGRCHHAALLAARDLAARESHALVLAAASDGVDGTSGSSGAWATAADWRESNQEAQEALATFASARFLDARGRSVDIGPTGTNVNDLWVVVGRQG